MTFVFQTCFNSLNSLLILTTLWMLSMTYKRNYIRCKIVFEIKRQKCTFLLCKTYTYNGKLMMYIAAALKYMGPLYILNGKLDASSVDTYFKLVNREVLFVYSIPYHLRNKSVKCNSKQKEINIFHLTELYL